MNTTDNYTSTVARINPEAINVFTSDAVQIVSNGAAWLTGNGEVIAHVTWWRELPDHITNDFLTAVTETEAELFEAYDATHDYTNDPLGVYGD